MPGDAYAFQGDEEHIIFLTMVAAPGEARIGVLSNDSAHQRFNVAAGPAQDQLWLFHSATLDILSPACMRHRWPIKVRRVSASLAKAYPPDGETGAAKRRQDKESNASLSPSRLDGTASGWRWFRARDAEAHVLHPSSVAVSREPGAKTDRLDTELSVGARDRGRHRDGRHAGARGAVAAGSIEAHVIHAATMGDALSPSCRQCTTVVDLASWLTDPAEIHAGR